MPNPTSKSTSLQIWGRANSVNVQKVLWCCRELGVPFQRIDAGMQFGRNTEADYLAMNPNGRVPTLVDGDFVLWESNAILRYIALSHGATTLYPAKPKIRAGIERWLDWTLSTLQPVERPLFWGLVRTPVAERDMAAMQQAADTAAVQWRIIDHQLATREYIEGEGFSLADIAIGAYARRWFGVEGVTRPALPHLEQWFALISIRPAFQEFVAPPMS
ncbi:glutathione S-transferase family protein [Tardiphaga sp.]|uniref:glutathione S-transferase family protein n=1 Tax=Tardiphaga sp. TaxID=1926292 RepID=UPI00261A7165|nr:glutathione S-transferase family protein [Tardiphaga sp.]MDB5616201.1 putative glutathione S-transferase [Tardiphaga sp.]